MSVQHAAQITCAPTVARGVIAPAAVAPVVLIVAAFRLRSCLCCRHAVCLRVGKRYRAGRPIPIMTRPLIADN